MWLDAVIFIIGLIAVLTIYLPFSPMTIDLLLLPRNVQIAIFRRRHWLWAVAWVCFLVMLGRSLAGAGWLGSGSFYETIAGLAGESAPGWHWAVLGAAAMTAMMFWTGYVPYVMTPPSNPDLLDVAAADKLLHPDDMVLGVVHDGEARAYSRDLIARPHYYNDTVGGQPLTVSYCILCNSGMGFKSELDGRPMNLSCVTAYNNNIIYREPDTGNFIQQLDGEVFHGPDKGKSLEPFPVQQTSWDEWKRLYPETTFFHAPHEGFRDKMVGAMLKWMIPIRKLKRRRTPWHRVRGQLDKRLPAMSFVLGVEIKGETAAYPLDDLRDNPVVNDVVGGEPIVVFYDTESDVADVFSRRLGERTLNFEPASGSAVAKGGGAEWHISGAALGGTLQGHTLEPVAHYNKLFWFSWALFKPGTRVGAAAG